MADEASSSSATTTTKTLLSKSALQDNIDSKGKNAYYFAHAHKATGPTWDGKPEPRLLSKTTTSSSSFTTTTTSSVSDAEPTTTTTTTTTTTSSYALAFDVHQSNITSYAFADEEKKVKLYIELEGGVGDCYDGNATTNHNVTLNWTSTSLHLSIRNYQKPTTTITTTTANGDNNNNNNKKNDGEEAMKVDGVDATTTTTEEEKEEELRLVFGRLRGRITKATYKVKPNRIVLILTKEKPGEVWHTINDKGSPDHELV